MTDDPQSEQFPNGARGSLLLPCIYVFAGFMTQIMNFLLHNKASLYAEKKRHFSGDATHKYIRNTKGGGRYGSLLKLGIEKQTGHTKGEKYV